MTYTTYRRCACSEGCETDAVMDSPLCADCRTEGCHMFPAQSPEQMLREFHASKAIHAGLMPSVPTPGIPEWVRDLRTALLVEEVRELTDAAAAGDIVGIADGIADVVYVAIGTAVAYGIPFDEVFREVHRSNMTKVNTPDEAKLVKGLGYEPPRIAEILGEMSNHSCPRGVGGCDNSSCQWKCPDCGCQNCHEAFCYQCGGGCEVGR